MKYKGMTPLVTYTKEEIKELAKGEEYHYYPNGEEIVTTPDGTFPSRCASVINSYNTNNKNL